MADVITTTLNNGTKIPRLGLGVWQVQEGSEVEDAVQTALKTGYRLIDTAAAYGNEAGVGKAIRESGVPRKDIFVTTKLWNSDHGYANALRAFDRSLKQLGLDYVDLYLIHWPVPVLDRYIPTWRALEKVYAEGRVRAIGVSNFMVDHLKRLLTEATIVPTINQIELHPRLQQKELRDYCLTQGIQVESWSPIMRGRELLRHPTLDEIAARYGKSTAQIILRWHIQNNLIAIPKSIHAGRIKENFDVFDFDLSGDDMAAINALDCRERVGPHPATMNVT